VPVVADALDRGAVLDVVRAAEPEVIVHELTALSSASSLRNFNRVFAVTNRLRTEGTDHLIEAAQAAGARRFVVQSYAGWPYARDGGPVKKEDDPFDLRPPARQRASLAAILHLEAAALNARGLDGLVLRYGSLYGPGTSTGAGGEIVELLRKRRFPIIGDGEGVWSFIHVDDAAAATAIAVERGEPGVYNIVDDEPAPVREWLPALAAAVGARPPHRVPRWLGHLLAGEVGVSLMTRVPGASNGKANAALGWAPAYPSWRVGFRTGLGAASAEPARQ
jgi:nucleoside-diphosphate-sugar epimerase